VTLRYEQRRPGTALEPFVECLWAISARGAAATRSPERVVPDGCPELIVHLGDPFARQVGGRWVMQPRVFLAGTLSRPWLLRPGRRVDTVGIRFRAGETRAVLPAPMAVARDREWPLAGIVGRVATAALGRALRDARTTKRRFAAAERWLDARLAEAPLRRATSATAVALIREGGGRARIDDIARSLGWSRRRLERVFVRDLGIRPKVYARIVRLSAVLATLDDADRASAVDVALDAGYFDQAHLLRDFRLLAGRTPRSGRSGDGPMARHFTDPRRLKALLAGE
jgi:AraC-like DNA-binding protein